MHRRHLCWLLGCALAVPRVALAAPAPRLHLQLEGLAAAPLGSYASAGDTKASEVFGTAGGFAATLSLGLRQNLSLAVRVGACRSRKDGLEQFRHPLPVSGLEGPALFATRRELVSVPIHALIQYRHSLAGGLGSQA